MIIQCTTRCCHSIYIFVIINYKPGWSVQNFCVSCVLGAVHNSRHFVIRHLSDDAKDGDDYDDDGDDYDDDDNGDDDNNNDDNDGNDDGDKWLR